MSTNSLHQFKAMSIDGDGRSVASEIDLRTHSTDALTSGINTTYDHKEDPSSSSSSSSSTDGSHEIDDDTLKLSFGLLTVGAVLCLIIVFTLLGNGLVVGAVLFFRRLRSVTNYFVVSLAVADLTVALLVMPYSVMYEMTGRWAFSWVVCYFWITCDVMCCTASILHLCVIAVDRYLAITEPLTYAGRMSSRRAATVIGAVWGCSAAISFVPIFAGWFADTTRVTLYRDSLECGLHVNPTYAVVSSATSFYLPLGVMAIVYARIFQIARHQSTEIQRLEGSLERDRECGAAAARQARRRGSRDKKAVKTLGTLMGLFCVSWLPFFVVYLMKPFCERCAFPTQFISAITWLGYCNSFFNPCVYALMNRDFRFAYKSILMCQRSMHGSLRRTCSADYPTDGNRLTVFPGGGRPENGNGSDMEGKTVAGEGKSEEGNHESHLELRSKDIYELEVHSVDVKSS